MAVRLSAAPARSVRTSVRAGRAALALDLPLLAQARLLERLQLPFFDFGEGLDLPRQLGGGLDGLAADRLEGLLDKLPEA